MAKEFKSGDKVEWDYSSGKVAGTVKRKLTKTAKIKGHTAKATKEDPQYLVESDKSGQRAAHKPDELRRRK